MDRGNKMSLGIGVSSQGNKKMSGGSPTPPRPAEFPLRILVLSEMVGAIIGRQGSTIKSITQQSRARVDVHRKDNSGSLEKVITIYGNPENCTNACKRILEVMQEEAINTNKRAIPLKILAHNNLIGRIIGKGGATIKKIMDETNAKITVSSISDINYDMERIITIKGTVEDIAKAENIISAKLRLSFESDLQNYCSQSNMFPGLPPVALMSTVGCPRGCSYSSPNYSPMYTPPYMAQMWHKPSNESAGYQECAHLYVPNTAVGALIGTRGSHIRNVIKFSGATVKIAPLEDGPESAPQERKVTIVGTPEAQWKAQYVIFEKLREEGFMMGTDEVRLTVEIEVPTSQVGRIIGKGGQNVRDLQRQSGALVKLSNPEPGCSNSEETVVHIDGSFYAVQSAQRRIRAIILGNSPGGAGRNSRLSSP